MTGAENVGGKTEDARQLEEQLLVWDLGDCCKGFVFYSE